MVYRSDMEIDFLTKGDNNPVDDRGLYPRNQRWLHKENIIGKATGFVYLSGKPPVLTPFSSSVSDSPFGYQNHLFRFLPYFGMVTIIMNDFPMLKYGMIAFMGLMVLVHKDSY